MPRNIFTFTTKQSMSKTNHFFTLAAVACLLICSGISNFSLGQTPAPPQAAAAAWNAGLEHLQNSRWQQARQSFDLVLRIAPTYAPAHFGKFLASIQVTEATLRDEWKLAIDDHPLLRAAIEHADPAYRTLLEGYVRAINERIAAEQANIPQDGRPAGERMVLEINGVEYAFRWCPPGWW